MTGIAASAAPALTIAAPMPLAPPVTSTTLLSSCRSTVLSQSAVQIHETAIQRVIHSGNERSRVRTQEEGKRGNLVRFSHSADRLRLRQFLEHLLLAAGIILFQIAIDKCRVHSGWRYAVTSNVVANIVTRDGIGHRNHRAFAGGVCEAISQSSRSGHRSHVQNDSASCRLHRSDHSIDTVEIAFDINPKNPIEVVLSRAFDRTNVRDT